METPENMQTGSDWRLYTGSGNPAEGEPKPIPDPPPWRRFSRPTSEGVTYALPDPSTFGTEVDVRGSTYKPELETIDLVNAAIYLGRPLLITGKPGTGKSSLAYSVAHELKLGPVLRWNITSRSTLREGLYEYDALRRLADYNMNRSRPIGEYFALGPLGTALLPWPRPRVLLIDEIDKGDMDLPNDLLNIFEEESTHSGRWSAATERVSRNRAEGSAASRPARLWQMPQIQSKCGRGMPRTHRSNCRVRRCAAAGSLL